MEGKVWQEFYCNKAGDGCGGYFSLKLHMHLNRKVVVICPKCGHRHDRYIVDGEIKDNHTFRGGVKYSEEELYPTIASWSEEPQTVVFRDMEANNKDHGSRNAVIIKSKSDLLQSWRDHHAKV